MLTKIIIKNLAIIKDVEIDFTSGLNIITGETGAGKSMLIDALTLLSGGRASVEVIREGEDTCEVQGVFETADISKEIKKELSNNDISIEDELVIRRVLQRSGKSRAYINGVIVTQGFLEEMGKKLVSILSQHESQSLFQPIFQLELLDRFLKNTDKTKEVENSYREWKEIENKYNGLKNSQSDYVKKVDYLKYQINEVEEHNFKIGEEEELAALVSRADHSVAILKTLYNARDVASYGEDSASARLNMLVPELSKCRDLEPEIEPLLETLNDALIKLEDLAKESDKLSKGYDFDPEELETNRERLSEIKRLKKKFACEDLDSILKNCEEMKRELASLENLEENIINLEKEVEALKNKYDVKAAGLSKYRKDNSTKLSKKIESILEDLGMFKGGFHVNFTPAQPSPTGVDRVDYLISTNPGEPMKAISKIASGGEMSRLMLAVQASTNEVYGYGIQVFDEVDAGIGGDIGFKVGGLLKRISGNHQVIVITHLPQIAVFSDQHLRVWKEEAKGRTHVRVEHLDSDTKFNEVTRMLGMENHTAAVNNVKEMISKAKKLLQSQTL
jgi:DNA repair protein RecN (Recombination protein N)